MVQQCMDDQESREKRYALLAGRIVALRILLSGSPLVRRALGDHGQVTCYLPPRLGVLSRGLEGRALGFLGFSEAPSFLPLSPSPHLVPIL